MVINNYSGSIVRLKDVAASEDANCMPRLSYCLPHNNDVIGFAFEATSLFANFTAFIFQLPCDYVNSVSLASRVAYLQAQWALNPLLFADFYASNLAATDTFYQPIGAHSVVDSFIFWDIPYTTNQCFCYVVFEATASGGMTFKESAYKSQCFQEVGDVCSTFEVRYFNTQDSLGLPNITTSDSTFYYSGMFGGKLWKPQIETEQKTYIKSNNENVIISSRSDESWRLDVDALNYQDHRALQIALRSDTLTIVSKDFSQFTGLPYEPTGTENDFIVTENYNIKYLAGCYESARGEVKLRRKDPIGLVNYQC